MLMYYLIFQNEDTSYWYVDGVNELTMDLIGSENAVRAGGVSTEEKAVNCSWYTL